PANGARRSEHRFARISAVVGKCPSRLIGGEENPMATTSEIPLAQQQHLVLSHVGWEFYERVLEEIGNRQIRITYFDGTIEIMSPLLKHELAKCAIGRLIETLTYILDINLLPAGSTTFRRRDKSAGLEPDECYYLKNAAVVRGMERFDPKKFPPPDLAIEV